MLSSVSVQIRLAIAVGRLGVVVSISISVGKVSVGVRMYDRCDTIAVGRCLTVGQGFAIDHRLNGSRVSRIAASEWNAALRVVLHRRLNTLDLTEQTVVRVGVGVTTSIACVDETDELTLDICSYNKTYVR